MLTEKEQKFLLKLARDAIAMHAISNGNAAKSGVFAQHIPNCLKEKRGVFVTLHKNGELRGCIGSLTAASPLYKAVINNAINAAYNDYRFSPVAREEISQLVIEISILTEPAKLHYAGPNDLLDKLSKEFGVILKNGYKMATFLPQVWEQISSKEEFLAHLCMKAGLHLNAWKAGNTEVYVYKAEKFLEEARI